jgi:hypothetical protein
MQKGWGEQKAVCPQRSLTDAFVSRYWQLVETHFLKTTLDSLHPQLQKLDEQVEGRVDMGNVLPVCCIACYVSQDKTVVPAPNMLQPVFIRVKEDIGEWEIAQG